MGRRDELLSAGVFAATGAAVLVASWRMDRLADRGIEALSVPGLMPGLVGLLMVLLSLVLAWQARTADGSDAEPAVPGAARRTGLALLLCVLFAGITLGHGTPFVVEGAVFVFVFTALFSWSEWRAARCVGRGLLQTALVAVLSSVFISWLFESVFLVRLP